MAKLIAPNAIVSPTATLEEPVRVFAYASIQSRASIGRYTYINRYTFVAGGVSMGRYCSVARGCDIGAVAHRLDLMSLHPFQYNKKHFESAEGYLDYDRHITIEKLYTDIGHDVWIGAQSIIAAGVKIGTGAVVAANAFVKDDVPPYAIVGGTPARVISYRFEPDVIEKLLASEWWELLPGEMAGVDFEDIPKALDQIAERKAALKAIEDADLAKKNAIAAIQAKEAAAKSNPPKADKPKAKPKADKPKAKPAKAAKPKPAKAKEDKPKTAPSKADDAAEKVAAIAKTKSDAAAKKAKVQAARATEATSKLQQGLVDMNIDTDISDAVMKYAKPLLKKLDPQDTNHMTAMRNKLSAVAAFANDRDGDSLGTGDHAFLKNLFAQLE